MLSIAGQSPSEGEKLVDLDSLIELTIVDDGSGIDTSSVAVTISGKLAVDQLEFKDGFDGAFSDILFDGENIEIVIHPEVQLKIGTAIKVQVQAQDLDGKYFNTSYIFKTTPAEPMLELSSPKSGDILKSDQVLFLQFTDTIDDVDEASINISLNKLQIVISGEIEPKFDGELSEVRKITNGASVRIEPKEPLRTGSYVLSYSVKDLSGNKKIGKIDFSIALPSAMLPSVFPQVSFVGKDQGIKRISCTGKGTEMELEWYKPISRSYRGDSFVLIYQNSSRLEIFDSAPSYIATSSISSATVTGFTPGVTQSFAARAFETFRGSMSLDTMELAADGLYLVPASVTISELTVEDDAIINVSSTAGYPSNGNLIINSSEVVKYTAKTDTSFLVPTGGRGLNGTSPGIHMSGDSVKLFLACQDSNTVIVMATPHYEGVLSGREIDNVGLVVTDYTDNDQKFFQGFDFCGYHQAIPQDILQGKNNSDCGSYLGGEFNGQRGMNIFDRMLNREEVLLDQTGEPVVLLRRMWDGATCSCSTSRRNHPKVKGCKLCYGTGYVGGFDQFENRRREDKRVMVMFGDTTEDLKLGAHAHLEQSYEPQCWTLPTPAIRDRDLVVRFDFNDDIEYIYEVLDVTKDKLFYRHFTRQKLKLKRLDKTDIGYQFPFSFST
jgi:hypothetical protein